MRQYEYLTAHAVANVPGSYAHDDGLPETLNDLGAQGWRLVQMGPAVAYFVREVVSMQPEGEIEFKDGPSPETMTVAQERMAKARAARGTK